MSMNSGDDVAGIVHAIGSEVAATGEFRIGDRVAGFHKMLEPGGAYAEYAVVPASTAFIIPQRTSFEGLSGYRIDIDVLLWHYCLHMPQRLQPFPSLH